MAEALRKLAMKMQAKNTLDLGDKIEKKFKNFKCLTLVFVY